MQTPIPPEKPIMRDGQTGETRMHLCRLIHPCSIADLDHDRRNPLLWPTA